MTSLRSVKTQNVNRSTWSDLSNIDAYVNSVVIDKTNYKLQLE